MPAFVEEGAGCCICPAYDPGVGIAPEQAETDFYQYGSNLSSWRTKPPLKCCLCPAEPFDESKSTEVADLDA